MINYFILIHVNSNVTRVAHGSQNLLQLRGAHKLHASSYGRKFKASQVPLGSPWYPTSTGQVETAIWILENAPTSATLANADGMSPLHIIVPR